MGGRMVPCRDGRGGAARLLLVLGLALGLLACVGQAVGSPGWKDEAPPATATPCLLLQRGGYATADESDPAALAWAGRFTTVEEVPEDHRLERDDLYFYALGAPLGESYAHCPGGYLRYFTRGLVLVGAWQEPTTLTLRSAFIPADRPFYDAFERRWGRTGDGVMTVTVYPRPDPLTGRIAPSGRLYLYALPPRLYLPLILRGG